MKLTPIVGKSPCLLIFVIFVQRLSANLQKKVCFYWRKRWVSQSGTRDVHWWELEWWVTQPTTDVFDITVLKLVVNIFPGWYHYQLYLFWEVRGSIIMIHSSCFFSTGFVQLIVDWCFFLARWFGIRIGAPRFESQSLSCSRIPGIQTTNPNHQLSNEKNPGCLGCIGDYTILCYRDCNVPL